MARLVGTSVDMGAVGAAAYSGLLAREFNYVTPENVTKWGPLQPSAGSWDFSAADQLVALATANAQKIKGHALIWHMQAPDWSNALAGQALIDAVHAHVTQTVRHFKGKVHAWDVVNEALLDGGAGLRPGVHATLGIQGIADAFKWAKAEDPDALLYYNDYGIESLDAKSDAALALVKQLLGAGAPIDGVGFQSHFSTKSYPSAAALRASIRRFADLGLSVNLSELDVRTAEVPGTQQERWISQGVTYREIAAACAAEPACDALTLWGFTDAHSWVDTFFGADDPLPFDDTYGKKPAYAGLFSGLAGMPPAASANLAASGSCDDLSTWIAFGGGTLSTAVGGRTGVACQVAKRTQPFHGPGLPLTGKITKGATLSVSAYAKVSAPGGQVNLVLKKVEQGVADEYRWIASRPVNDTDWTLLSGNVVIGWDTVPSELVVFFESPASGGGTFANLLVDDVTLQVLSL